MSKKTHLTKKQIKELKFLYCGAGHKILQYKMKRTNSNQRRVKFCWDLQEKYDGYDLAKIAFDQIEHLQRNIDELQRPTFFYNVDDWEYTTSDVSILEDELSTSPDLILRLGRLKKLPDRYIVLCENGEHETEGYIYCDSIDEAQNIVNNLFLTDKGKKNA